MMTESSEASAGRRRWGGLPVALGIAIALFGAAAGFLAVREGLVALPAGGAPDAAADVAFVSLDPVVIALQTGPERRHLRFRAALEVPAEHRAEVEGLRPRVVDVLHGYLRALEPEEIDAPGALARLRAQMLRRVQIVTGDGRVEDLLVMEFVLN